MFAKPEITKKWEPILNHPDLPAIKDPHKRNVTALMLENVGATHKQQMLTETPHANFMGASSSTHGDGGIDIFDPVMMTMVRRAMPNLIAYDICGVQPMTGPTGLIFALRVRYSNQTGGETFYNEVNTAFSTVVSGANTLGLKHTGTIPGNTTYTANLAAEGLYNFAGGMSTAVGEELGNATVAFPEMAFTIERFGVQAKERGLKAEYTMELAQDVKAIHNIDVENELAGWLSTELMAEINREVVRTIYVTAVKGSTTDTTTAGIFDLDTDSNGRWSVERFKGLMFHLDRECNQIAKETRRGKGNFMICSSDVASALSIAGELDYAPALQSNQFQVDDTGHTFVGVLNNRIRVYIDPYVTGGNYCVVGYKGQYAFDAGLYYCPYVPLQMVRATDPNTFQPKIGFKTRYGMVANPFAQGATQGLGALVKDSNVFYRRTLITHLM
jgi:hypothetical protein